MPQWACVVVCDHASKGMAGGARGCGVVVSVSFTSPGRLSSRADCCWTGGDTLGEVVLLGLKGRREEGVLTVVGGRRGRRREDQQDERRPRGARRAPSISSFIAHFRQMTRSLTSPRIPEIAGSKPHLQPPAGPGTLRGVIIKPRYTTRQPPSCSVLCSVPRTGITCANGHARVPALTHARRKDADCPPLRRTCHHSRHLAFVRTHAPRRSTWTRHVLASTKACDLRSAVHTPSSTLRLHCIASEKHPTL